MKNNTLLIVSIMLFWLSVQPMPMAKSQQRPITDSIKRIQMVDSIKRLDERIIITKIQIRVKKEELKNLKKTLRKIKRA
jgi:hypothetical protein